MNRRLTAVVFVAALLVFAGCATSNTTSQSETPTHYPLFEKEEGTSVEVLEVVDGDTLEVRMPDGDRETVRLLGVDTPETYGEPAPSEWERVPVSQAGKRCLSREGETAKRFVHEKLAEGDVRIVFDSESDKRGYYDRLLGYVVVDGENLNKLLLKRGLARYYDSSFSQSRAFREAESTARASKTGAWGCVTPSSED